MIDLKNWIEQLKDGLEELESTSFSELQGKRNKDLRELLEYLELKYEEALSQDRCQHEEGTFVDGITIRCKNCGDTLGYTENK